MTTPTQSGDTTLEGMTDLLLQGGAGAELLRLVKTVGCRKHHACTYSLQPAECVDNTHFCAFRAQKIMTYQLIFLVLNKFRVFYMQLFLYRLPTDSWNCVAQVYNYYLKKRRLDNTPPLWV